MALETERCSPQNASSPGPNEVTQNPGTNGGSSSSGYASPVVTEASIHSKSKSAFHQIALLSQKIEGAAVDILEEKPSPAELYSATVTPTSLTTSTPPSNFCSPISTSGCAHLSNDSASSSPELTSAKEVPLTQLSMLQPPAIANLVAPTLPPSYACHKFTPEMYIAQLQNFHAAAAGGLPFNPFMFPGARLPALKMQLYNSGVAPALNMTANDYMLGLHNAKLMCEMLQIQQQQHSSVVIERGRSKPNDDPSLEEVPSHSPSAGVSVGTFTSSVTVSNGDMYSRPDSPCSSVNSSKCYKQCSCSPSSIKGEPSRSPSPVALCQAASQAAPPTRPLPFSVDNILRPEFGKSLHSVGSTTSNGVDHHAKLVATVAAAGKRRRASSPLQQLMLPRSKHLKYERMTMDDSASVTSTKDSMSPRPTTDNEESADRLTDDSSSTCDKDSDKPWPAWVYCTRYSDRPSSGE
ncbi:hypothetical protein V9T40_013629 [Parthenolecanium corni]|uniref:Uncharacterized protein n=1 Tax=Parthenolecanium corni TaxID=536013 RepID=A0AAN9TD04_9HEMI